MLVSLAACGAAVLPGPTSAPAQEPVAAPVAAPAQVTADRDGDGILDAQDGCPDVAEDLDQFEDGDGCVDRDNDGDGFLDAYEFKDGRWTNCDYRQEDGVDVDCRNLPEDDRRFEARDGCPDTIRLDQCPTTLAEPVPLDRRGRLISAGRILDEVAALLRAAPDTGVWVLAHVDKQRDPAVAKRMSQGAADAVIEALVQRGVARDWLEPVGYGDEQPVDRRTNAAGRARNRRVEFRLHSCARGQASASPGLASGPRECR